MAEHESHSERDIQSEGRKENAALPLNADKDNAGAERYPQVRQDDGVEARSFAPGNPQPRQGAGDGGPAASTTEGRMGPGGDPAEGKR